jgi:branched-chain amino acid transport system ATP-binding protein
LEAAILELRKVGLSFGGLQALKDLDLVVREGELVGLIGPNGAGKTTAFNVISGVYAPTEGEVRFAGQDLAGLRPFEVTARGVSRTFQSIRLFNELTVIENVAVAEHFRRGYGLWDAALRTRRFVEAERRITRKAEELLSNFGLHDRRNDPAASLSYGGQRRLEIARALATGPRLLLLDEPAAGMNPAEISELMELIVKARQAFGLTILLIEHNMHLVMNVCQRIAVLDFGVKIAEGSPKEIQNDPRVLEAYLGQEVSLKATG